MLTPPPCTPLAIESDVCFVGAGSANLNAALDKYVLKESNGFSANDCAGKHAKGSSLILFIRRKSPLCHRSGQMVIFRCMECPAWHISPSPFR
jgi:hypothetical protein